MAQPTVLEENLYRWNRLYDRLHVRLAVMAGIISTRKKDEFNVGSTIQFRADVLPKDKILAFVDSCAASVVELK